VRELHRRGWHFYKFIEPDVYRLMCSWSTTDRDIAAFVAEVVALKG
jgi:threonine aldolase